MTEPEWKNVTPKPAGYMRAHDAQQLSEGYSGWVWPNNGLHNADDVPVYLAPIVPTEQPGQPQPHMQGYSECKAWAMDVIERAKQQHGEGSAAWIALASVLKTLRQNEAAR